jgi:histidine ammonia-lyase
MLAQPVSLQTGDTSAGQEDYMSMAIPAIQRLDEMAQLCRAMFAYELLAGTSALRRRSQQPGDGVRAVLNYLEPILPPLQCDRAPGPDVEALLEQFDAPRFIELMR